MAQLFRCDYCSVLVEGTDYKHYSESWREDDGTKVQTDRYELCDSCYQEVQDVKAKCWEQEFSALKAKREEIQGRKMYN